MAVSAVGPAFTVNAAVDALHAAGPGRKRPADELSALDTDAEHLEAHLERIVQQRRGASSSLDFFSLLQMVRSGDVAMVQDGIDDGADIDEQVQLRYRLNLIVFLSSFPLKQATFDLSQTQNTPKVACVQGEST